MYPDVHCLQTRERAFRDLYTLYIWCKSPSWRSVLERKTCIDDTVGSYITCPEFRKTILYASLHTPPKYTPP